jgi:integrase
MLGTTWLEAHQARMKASTLHSDESAWRIHVQPKWGRRPVGSIRQSEVKAWISTLGAKRSPTTVARAYGVLASILDGAVQDKRLNTNPARGDKVKLPRKTSAPRAYLTHSQVESLAAESKYPDFVLFLTYTGLRWGEATGLRVGHLDRTRRRIDITENARERQRPHRRRNAKDARAANCGLPGISRRGHGCRVQRQNRRHISSLATA